MAISDLIIHSPLFNPVLVDTLIPYGFKYEAFIFEVLKAVATRPYNDQTMVEIINQTLQDMDDRLSYDAAQAEFSHHRYSYFVENQADIVCSINSLTVVYFGYYYTYQPMLSQAFRLDSVLENAVVLSDGICLTFFHEDFDEPEHYRSIAEFNEELGDFLKLHHAGYRPWSY